MTPVERLREASAPDADRPDGDGVGACIPDELEDTRVVEALLNVLELDDDGVVTLILLMELE